MSSSGSTPSPSAEPELPLFVLLVGEDHPKSCTGRRLLRRGLARPIPARTSRSSRAIVLDPHADRPLSPDDRTEALRSGILAVDCSWNRLGERGRLPTLGDAVSRHAVRRRLPILLAANPQHFGRPTELNTVEALAAATFVLGRRTQAERLLEGFRGGPEFLLLNRDRLSAYAGAPDAVRVRDAERSLFG